MNCRIHHLLLRVSALAALVATPVSLHAQPDSTPLPRVELRVVNEAGELIEPLTLDSAAVAAATIAVPSGASAKTLLRSQGIFPDADALAWLLAANPALTAVDTLTAGQSLRIPQLRPGTAAERAVQNGNLVAFVLEPQLRDSAQIALTQAIQTVSAIAGPREGRVFNDAIEAAADIDLDASGATPDVIRLVMNRVDRLEESAAAFGSATLVKRRAALSEAAAFEAEFAELAEAVEAGRAPLVDVRISLFYDDDGSPVTPGPYVLRWATAGDRASCRRANCGRPFRISSPEPRTSLRLNANYVVWAVFRGNAASCDTSVDPVDGAEPRWDVRIFRNPPPPPTRCQ